MLRETGQVLLVYNTRMLRFLTVHNKPHEFFVVDVALRVFLVDQQLFDLIVCQLLAKRRQQMSELSRWDETAGVLVEVTQTFDKIIGSVTGTGLWNGLIDRQKYFKGNALVCLQLVCTFLHIGFGRILAKRTQAFANLYFCNIKKMVLRFVHSKLN